MTEGMPVPRTEPIEGCPACQEPVPQCAFLRLTDRLLGVPGTPELRRCPACGTVYQSPRVIPADLPLLYTGDYYTHKPPPSPPDPGSGPVSLGAALRKQIRHGIQQAILDGPSSLHPWNPYPLLSRIRLLRERAFWDLPDGAIPGNRHPGAALEIGPGSGWDLALLSLAGWDAVGSEWDPEAARVAAAASGRPVRAGDFMGDPALQGPFHLIYLHHVFEHLPKPREALEWMRDHLQPQGRILLVVPNPDAAAAVRWGETWTGWDPPRHLTLLSLRGFEILAQRVGLKVEATSRFRGSWAQEGFALEQTGRHETPTRAVRTAFRLLKDRLEGWRRPASRPAGTELHLLLTRSRPPGLGNE